MTQKMELVNKVKNYFNLNIYETKVWLALLNKGIASAGEVSEVSGVPRSRTYDVLEGLEKRGFAMQKIGKPVKYFAVKPTMVIEKLKKNTVDEMNERIELLSNIKSTPEYQELELLHNTKSELIKKQDISTTVKGRANINNQISGVLASGKKEVVICAPVSEIKKRMKLLEPVITQLVNAKTKITVAINGTDEEIKEINDRLGINAKKVDLNSAFYISDKKEVLFMLNDSENHDEQMAVWFSAPFFVESFSNLFEMATKRGK